MWRRGVVPYPCRLFAFSTYASTAILSGISPITQKNLKIIVATAFGL
jgi:hypothetical protein